MKNVALLYLPKSSHVHLPSLPGLMDMGRPGDYTAVAFHDKTMTPVIARNFDQLRNRYLSSDFTSLTLYIDLSGIIVTCDTY